MKRSGTLGRLFYFSRRRNPNRPPERRRRRRRRRAKERDRERETERERQREEFFLLRHRSLSLFQFLNAFFGWHFAVDCSGTPNGFVCRKVGTFFLNLLELVFLTGLGLLYSYYISYGFCFHFCGADILKFFPQ